MCILANLDGIAFAQKNGAITFNDNGPPLTEAQRQLTTTWLTRAREIHDLLPRLAGLIRATVALRAELKNLPSSDAATLSNIQKKEIAWEAAQATLFKRSATQLPLADPNEATARPPEFRWSIQPDSFPTYVSVTVDLTGTLSASKQKSGGAGGPPNVAVLRQDSARALSSQLRWFDALVAEHGNLNKRLRYYPYNGAGQAPVECDLVNRYSRAFKCVPNTATGVVSIENPILDHQFSVSDYCVAEGLQPYAMADSTKMHTLGKSAAIATAAAEEGLANSLVGHPFDAQSIDLKCAGH